MSDETLHHDEPLTPEERALAQRLARTAPRGEPSSALDARILAAAHAAASESSDGVAMHARRPRGRRSRWPALLGYAATAAIACGIAWQLRPLPEPQGSMQAAAHTEDPLAEYNAPPPMQGRVVPRKPLQVPEPPPAESTPQQARSASVRPATRADAKRKPEAFDTLPPFEIDEAIHPAADADAAASGNVAAAAAAAPAAPPPPPAAMERAAVAPAAAPSAKAAADSRAQRQAADLGSIPVPRDLTGVDTLEDRGEPASAEADEEVVPPATADSPAVREAWLQRIRELQRAGDLDAARASLREFRHRYPHQVVPEDLRALGE